MIGRRTLLGWFACLPFWTGISLVTRADAVNIPDLPADPQQRLRRLCWQFERRARHKWHVEDYSNWTYVGAAWNQRPTPTGRERIYQHHHVCGEGTTAIEAIDDWYSKLPTERCDVIFWRVKPELVFDTNYDSKQTIWRVFSRFAIVPLGELS